MTSRLRESPLLRGLRLKLRDQIRSQPPRWEATRDDLAFRYLSGNGIEIGALYRPQRVPPGATVTYVDHAAADELRRIYSEHDWIQPPDVVDEAERLTTFADDSLDFVMANHVLEHVEDPVAALSTFLRVVRPGGVLFLTLPDARRSFDGPRERTTVEHLMRDHLEGAGASRSDHYLEYALLVEGKTGDDLVRRSAELAAQGFRIHFHVWEPDTFLELLLALQLPIDIEAVQATGIEFAVVLRKNTAKAHVATLTTRPIEQEGSMIEDDSPRERDPHHALNEPASDPDPTEWPDPYDKRPDPRDPEAESDELDFGDVHTPTGATSTSAPNHESDIEVDPRKANPHERDKSD